MIWHVVEVWLLFAIIFMFGCWIGASLYKGLALGPLAYAQGAVADRVGDVIDGIKRRFDIGPDWRPAHLPPVERPLPRRRRESPDPEPAPPEAIAALPPSWDERAEEPREPWVDGTAWEIDVAGVPDEAGHPDHHDHSDEAAAAPAGQSDDDSMMRPAGLAAPRSGVPDNLQRIRGIGRRNEELLHGLGIFHFGQIAAWTPAEARWVASHLAFPERIERDEWVAQAIVLASGGSPVREKPDSRTRRAAESGAD